jgi:hypothetical protein
MGAAVVILTADEMLAKGLELHGFDRTSKVSCSLKKSRFKSLYGSEPVVYAQMWEDLQTTAVQEARVDARTTTIDHFLMSLHFLKCYPRESKLAADFKISEKTVRKWIRHFTKKIQALKQEKVRVEAAV